MNPHLRHATVEDAPSISTLVCAGFKEHIALDWEPRAQRHFYEENHPDKLGPKIGSACLCLLYEQDSQLLGVIFLPRPTLVQLFFVEPSHMGKGIGRSLWEGARESIEASHPEVRTVELNSSPYALNAYRALGFFPISHAYKREGAVATRMACWLPGRGLERHPAVVDAGLSKPFTSNS
jgi:GNAT superfamily N-acetyltransferase